jgi:hypothetical protein
MELDPPLQIASTPPLYKEVLVAILVGAMVGPIIGWFIGTFATFFAVVAMDTSNVRGMRGSGFIGGLIGIPLGLATGLAVCLPLRVLSSKVFVLLRNPWLAGVLGALMGSLCAYLILTNWYPSSGALVYLVIHCTFVGAVVGSIVVVAKPKWL